LLESGGRFVLLAHAASPPKPRSARRTSPSSRFPTSPRATASRAACDQLRRPRLPRYERRPHVHAEVRAALLALTIALRQVKLVGTLPIPASFKLRDRPGYSTLCSFQLVVRNGLKIKLVARDGFNV